MDLSEEEKKEGWVDNNIYASTKNDELNTAGLNQTEWEDNIILWR